jgi:hypothetical protein
VPFSLGCCGDIRSSQGWKSPLILGCKTLSPAIHPFLLTVHPEILPFVREGRRDLFILNTFDKEQNAWERD